MKTLAEQYFEELADRLQRPPDGIAVLEADDEEMPAVYVAHWHNWPETGLVTSFIYGLSELPAEVGKTREHELAITVRGTEGQAGVTLANLVEWQRYSAQFVPGALFHYGKPLAPGTAMDSLLLFQNPYDPPKLWERLPLGVRQITLLMAYPLYKGEVTLLQKVGMRKFLSQPEYKLFNLDRVDLSTVYKVGDVAG